jgi:hypothetical protein
MVELWPSDFFGKKAMANFNFTPQVLTFTECKSVEGSTLMLFLVRGKPRLNLGFCRYTRTICSSVISKIPL